MEGILKKHIIKAILEEFPKRLLNLAESNYQTANYTISKVVGGKIRKADRTEKNSPPWIITFADKTDLDDPVVQQGIIDAIKNKEENPKIFELTIKLLQNYPNRGLIKQSTRTLSTVEVLLMAFWFCEELDIRSFCFYSNKALAKFFQHRMGFNDGHFTEDYLRKIYTRFGLKKSKYILFTDLDTSGAEPLLVPSNKYFD
jgi:hypothetical protein